LVLLEYINDAWSHDHITYFSFTSSLLTKSSIVRQLTNNEKMSHLVTDKFEQFLFNHRQGK